MAQLLHETTGWVWPPGEIDHCAHVTDVDGVPTIDALIIVAPRGINGDLLRALSIHKILSLALEVSTEPRAPLTRPDGTDPDGFSRRVAAAYREAYKRTRTPAKALAEEAGVPVTTVHRWVREARRSGHLPKARRGRAG